MSLQDLGDYERIRVLGSQGIEPIVVEAARVVILLAGAREDEMAKSLEQRRRRVAEDRF